MIHKEVSAEKFDALMKKSINLKECPKCGRYGAQIRVDFPLYGKRERIASVMDADLKRSGEKQI